MVLVGVPGRLGDWLAHEGEQARILDGVDEDVMGVRLRAQSYVMGRGRGLPRS